MQGRARPVVVIVITRDLESTKRGIRWVSQSRMLSSFLYLHLYR